MILDSNIIIYAARPDYAALRNFISIAADLRRLYRTDLGDSIIAATSIFHKLTLATHNIADFKNIEGLAVYDPLTETHL